MPVPLADALLYAVAPAALGAALAVVLLLRAQGDLARPVAGDARPRLLVLYALPVAAVVLGAVGALVAQQAEADVALPLLALGVAGFAQAALQGWLGSRSLGAVLDDPLALGRSLVVLAIPELLTVGALVWVLQSAGAA